MIKRILVGLDGSSYSKSASQLASMMAKKNDGVVVGVASLDIRGIERSMGPVPLGGSYFAEQVIDLKFQKEEKKIKGYLNEFEHFCQENQVKYELVFRVGVPSEQLIEEGKTADVIILGLQTYFRFDSMPGNTLKKLMKSGVCPIIAVPEHINTFYNVLIAYDGSLGSAKAMRSFVQLANSLSVANKLVLVNINDNNSIGKKLLDEAQKYLAAYGLSVQQHLCSGEPKEKIYEIAQDMQPTLIVIGNFGNSKLQDLMWGSTTSYFVNIGDIPLLVHH